MTKQKLIQDQIILYYKTKREREYELVDINLEMRKTSNRIHTKRDHVTGKILMKP